MSAQDSLLLKPGERAPAAEPGPQRCDPIEVEVFAVDDGCHDDIDWEQLAREAHADFEAGNLNFISTHSDAVQARAALRKYLDDILEEVLNGIAASPGTDAARP